MVFVCPHTFLSDQILLCPVRQQALRKVASIKIQSLARMVCGLNERKRRVRDLCMRVSRKLVEASLATSLPVAARESLMAQIRAAVRMQIRVRAWIARSVVGRRRALVALQLRSAIKIQSLFRGFLCRIVRLRRLERKAAESSNYVKKVLQIQGGIDLDHAFLIDLIQPVLALVEPFFNPRRNSIREELVGMSVVEWMVRMGMEEQAVYAQSGFYRRDN